MLNLKTDLKNRLRGASRIAILGIGSLLRADDAAGTLVAQKLAQHLKKAKTRSRKVFLGESAPENLTGEIKRFKPAHLIIIDALDCGGLPGTVSLINAEQAAGESFSTHRLPLKVFCAYLTKSLDCRITIIGIQPKRLDFGTAACGEVKKSIGLVTDLMKHLLVNRRPSKAKLLRSPDKSGRRRIKNVLRHTGKSQTTKRTPGHRRLLRPAKIRPQRD
jgi:hydrogenase 3 maturation protease